MTLHHRFKSWVSSFVAGINKEPVVKVLGAFGASDKHLPHAALGTMDDDLGHFKTPAAFMVA